MNRRTFLASGISTIALCQMAKAVDLQTFQAEAASLIGGAFKTPDRDAPEGYVAALTEVGHGVTFSHVRAGSKLAIRYAALSTGTISVAVNNSPPRKVNIHSSGALTSSYLNAIVDLTIPANASVTISLASDDVGVNVDRILVGSGDMGLPPDTWNLPPLEVAEGPYSPDWKALGRPTPFRHGGVRRSSERGRTGTRNPCPSRAIGMREACTWKVALNMNFILNTSAIRPNTGTRTSAITG